ncbi:MAG TPA: phosphoglycerate mutase, partial [Ramlibacter sp.]|nr:phosphoglycerate mutase [Ramlibacter sp.]
MSDGVHLLISFAGCNAGPLHEALALLALPRLEQLLARLAPAGADESDASALSPPHERTLARLLGLPVADGRIPWAAWQARRRGHDTAGKAWARITPCHWKVETDHIVMGLPADLQLEAGESQVLREAMLR